MVSRASDVHEKEIDGIFACHHFLFELKIVSLSPADTLPLVRHRVFPDGEIRPVVHVPRARRMDIISYPSLRELMIDLMASVSFFLAEESFAKKYRIAATMVIAIGRHKSLAVEESASYYQELNSCAVKLFSEEFSDGPHMSASKLARCNANMKSLRVLAEKFGHPELFVSTSVYDPVAPSLKANEDTTSTQPVQVIDSVAPLCPTRRRLPAPRNPSADVSDWYYSRNLAVQDSSTAITALVKRYRHLRDEGLWPCIPASRPPPPMQASAEHGGGVVVFGRPSSWRVEWSEYFSLEAFFGDIMCTVCWLLSVPGEYEKRCRLAALLDCLARHWPAGNAEKMVFWEEMMSWMWKFVHHECQKFYSAHHSRTYLERCDKYLEEFQHLFVRRTSVRCPLNVWTRMYLPPGTVWRERIMAALNGHGETRDILLFKNPTFKTSKFVFRIRDLIDPDRVRRSRSPRKARIAAGVVACRPSSSETALRMSGSYLGSPEDSGEEAVFSPADDDTGPLEVPPPPSLRARMADEAMRSNGDGTGGNILTSSPRQTLSISSGQHGRNSSHDRNHRPRGSEGTTSRHPQTRERNPGEKPRKPTTSQNESSRVEKSHKLPESGIQYVPVVGRNSSGQREKNPSKDRNCSSSSRREEPRRSETSERNPGEKPRKQATSQTVSSPIEQSRQSPKNGVQSVPVFGQDSSGQLEKNHSEDRNRSSGSRREESRHSNTRERNSKEKPRKPTTSETAHLVQKSPQLPENGIQSVPVTGRDFSGKLQENLSNDRNRSSRSRREESHRSETCERRAKEHREPSAKQTVSAPVEKSPKLTEKVSSVSVSARDANTEEFRATVRVKQEAVDVVDLSSSSPNSDGTATDAHQNGGDANVDGVRGTSGRDEESNPEPTREETVPAPSEVNEPPTSADTKGFEGNESRKRRLDDKLGCDYRERMGSAQTLIRPCRDYFPRHQSVFDALDAHVTRLLESTSPAELTKMVAKLLDDRCLENVVDLLDNFLKKFSALVELQVKDEMETCLDALSLVLDDSRTLVDFQVQYEKKQRRQ